MVADACGIIPLWRVITHIWMTFLGPEPHAWAKNGSANHQEMLLRMVWDGSPGVEAPVGDFFANSFGKRSEVISLPVIDLYSPDILSHEVHLLDFWPDPGKYTLRLECVGKNPASTGHYLGLESVRLRERRPRVKAYRHDADKDWRKEPILYN